MSDTCRHSCREVKPACADDTAVKCGRVGRRQSLQKPLTILLVRGFLILAPCLIGILILCPKDLYMIIVKMLFLLSI
jgi:hypothetical protein